MRRRGRSGETRLAGRLVAALLAVLLLSAGPAAAERAAEKYTWELTDPRVLDPGETTTSATGTMIRGLVIEATARGEGAAPIQRGRFRLTLNFFNPHLDLPGQEAGFWYGTGSWSLTDLEAPVDPKTRYSPGMFRGSLHTRLTFNPTAQAGTVTAQVEAVTFRPGRGRQKGGGKFQGNEQFAGTLTVDMHLTPSRRTLMRGEMP